MVNLLSNAPYLLPPLITGVISFILLVFVLLNARKRSSTWIFCWLLASVVLTSFSIFGMRSSPDIHHALLWQKPVVVMSWGLFVFYYHFTVAYTNARMRMGILPSIYALVILIAILSGTTSLVLEGVRLEHYGYAPTFTTPGLFLLTSGSILHVAGAYNLIKEYKRTASLEERNRLLYLAIAILFPLLGGLLDGLTNLPPALIWGNLIFCIICTLAIVKYQLLDIHVVIQKSLVYILASSIIAVPYVIILVLLNQLLKARTEPWWVHALIILLLAILLRPLYSRTQNLVDKLFYRDRYDYLKALEHFSRQAQSILNLKELASNLVKLVSGALRTSDVCLLLTSEHSGGFVMVSCIGLEKPLSGTVLRNQSLLVKWLRLHPDILSSEDLAIIPQLQSLSHIEKANLERMRAKLYVPIRGRHGQLSGILALGPKLSQQLYSNEDKRLLAAVSSQMAMALENARLFDSEKTMRLELEKMNKRKTEFLHSVAHELKTPLTAVLSSSEILSEEKNLAEEQKKRLVNNIHHGASSMDKRVSELLDLARIQTGNIVLKKETMDLNGFLSNIALQLHPIFEARSQTLKLEIADSLPKINADRNRLEQIVYNLLTNANKFSPNSSNVVLRAKENNGQVIVEIEDSAPAISKEDKERIFEPYYRGEDINKREHFPGLGLGLSIAKYLVELHQGKIWFESKAQKGNNFAFSLPALDRKLSESGDQ